MEAKSTKVIYVTSIPKRIYCGNKSNKFILLTEQITKLPINKCIVEQYDNKKLANTRATAIRIHFKNHNIKGHKVEIVVRINTVYIWKIKEV